MSINEGGSVALIHDRAEQMVSEAIELALARMVLEAKAGRNRTELLDALEQIQINHPHNKTTPTSSGIHHSNLFLLFNQITSCGWNKMR